MIFSGAAETVFMLWWPSFFNSTIVYNGIEYQTCTDIHVQSYL